MTGVTNWGLSGDCKPSLPLDDEFGEETYTDEKALSESFTFVDEEGNPIEDEEDDFGYSEEEVYEDDSFGDYED